MVMYLQLTKERVALSNGDRATVLRIVAVVMRFSLSFNWISTVIPAPANLTALLSATNGLGRRKVIMGLLMEKIERYIHPASRLNP